MMEPGVEDLIAVRGKWERSLRNKQGWTIDYRTSELLAKTPIWKMLHELIATGIADSCHEEGKAPPRLATTTRPASSSAPTGSSIVPREMIGRSAGTIEQHVHDAAEKLALEAAATVGRRKRRGKHSHDTT